MYKLKVADTWQDRDGFQFIRYGIGYGSPKPRAHPFSLAKPNQICGSTIKLGGVKVGDLLRCDGLPYMSRPQPIYDLNYKYETYTKKGRKFMRSKALYWPFKLPNGFWVLRGQ